MDDSILALIRKFQSDHPAGEGASTAEGDSEVAVTEKDVSDILLGLLIFSKDRPFQLLQLLLSLEEVDRYPAKVIVLYSCSDIQGPWHAHYLRIVRKFSSRVHFQFEKDFSSDLLEIVNEGLESMDVIGFCVDDMLFTSQTPLHSYAQAILKSSKSASASSSSFAFHTKLHPGICFSHTRSEMSVVPTLTQSSGTNVPLVFSYELADTNGEWHYPFDLCGSLYRRLDVLTILETACGRADLGKDSFRNPNLLEKTGNQIFWESDMCRKFKCCLCASRRHLSVLTVNKVQTVFDVPIYATEGGDLSSLNNYFLDESDNDSKLCAQEVDTMYYGNDPRSMSVHVGGLHFRAPTASPDRTDKAGSEANAEANGVSLLIPVYNGEPYLESALQSAIEKPQGCTFEIVVVDDGSTDGTPEILRRSKSKAKDKGIPFIVLTLQANKGLINALEEGMRVCSFEFIARLDADDLLEDYRLSRQKAFLEHNRSIHVVGSQAVQIDGSDKHVPNLVRGMPTHPVMVAWEMLFRCCILHPSVMYRRSVIQGCGSYASSSEHASSVEDYDLWLRALNKHPFSVANLPDVLIRLRKHDTSKSSRESAQLRQQSRKLRLSAVQEMLGVKDMVDQSSMDVLCHPETYLTDKSQVPPALGLLDTMFEGFLQTPFPLQHVSSEGTGEDWDEEEKLMLKHALDKSKADKQERLCAAAIEKGLGAMIPEELREMVQRAEVRALKARVVVLADCHSTVLI